MKTPLALFATADGGLIQTEDGTYELTISDEDASVSLKLLDSVNKKVKDFAGSESGNTQFALTVASYPDELAHQEPPSETTGPNWAAGPLAFSEKYVPGEDYEYSALTGFPTFSGGCADASGAVAISAGGAAYAAGDDSNWRLGRGGLENATLNASAGLFGLTIANCQLSDTLSVFTTTAGQVYVGGNSSVISKDMLANPTLGWAEDRNQPKRLDTSFLREKESVSRAFIASGALYVKTN